MKNNFFLLIILLFLSNCSLNNKIIHERISYDHKYRQINFSGKVHLTSFNGKIKSIVVFDKDNDKILYYIKDSIQIKNKPKWIE